MRILFLSFYFEPDLCAGSFRNTSLVEALQASLPRGSEIDVLTTLPNRYSEFSVDAMEIEIRGIVSIKRVDLPSHKSGMLDQSKAFYIYANAVRKHVQGKNYDVVYASSSRMMTAFLGAVIARKIKAPLYLDIRDIFVDTIKDVLSKKVVFIMKPIFAAVESFTIKSASHLNVVSEGFVDYFNSRYSNLSTSIFTNGIDSEFVKNLPELEEPSSKQNGLIRILYAGNIGKGQGLHLIVPMLAAELAGRATIRLIGAGGQLGKLKSALNDANIKNVELLPPICRQQLIGEYQAADVLFLHLNDYDAFKKVLPSKIFEYGAIGKPILAGVAGYAAQFIELNIENSAIFPPCSVEDGVVAFNSLNLVTKPRLDFIDKYGRKRIMRKMATDVCRVGQRG